VLQETHAVSGGRAAQRGRPEGRAGYVERIPVESRGKIRYVAVSDIDYILASGPYAELVVADRKHLIREAMQNLENRLDPARFFRVHRSAIVQLDRVDALLKSPGGDCDIQLRSGVKLKVARSRREELEKRLASAAL
jgi:two-component system LytT family response regulator